MLEKIDHRVGMKLRHFYFREDAFVVEVVRCVAMRMLVVMQVWMRFLNLRLLPLLLLLLQLMEMVL